METSGDRPTRMTWRVCEGTDEQIAQLEADGLDESVTWFHEHLQETADQINDEITTHRDTMREQVAAILTARSKRIKAVRKAADALGIPLHPRGENERMPLRTRALTVRQLDEAVAAGTPEWHLEHAIAEQVVATITSFTTALERLVRTADKLARESEETLRDLLLFILNANFEGQATGETFTGIGKSDILLRWKDRNAFICECKFWTGPEGFAKAIDQLDGYTVWRDTRIGLILFIRDRADVTAAIDSARSVLAEHSRLVQALDPTEPERRCDYLMHASDDQRRVIRLSLLPVHIPRQS